MTLLALALILQDAATTTDTSVDPSLAAPSAHSSSAIMDMLHNSGPTALTVLGLLLIMSVISWAVRQISRTADSFVPFASQAA
jgi:biopolymer transport protein TolQ